MTEPFLTREVIKLRRKNKILRKLYPSWGVCKRCGKPWVFADSKVIGYSTSHATFSLCVKCWDKSDIEERIYYYTNVDHIKNNDENLSNLVDNILVESGDTTEKWLRRKKLEKINENRGKIGL